MIPMKTRLDVTDNTGAKVASCIKVLHRANTLFAEIGDVVTVNIKESAPDATVKKGEMAQGVIVRSRRAVRRQDGSYIRFSTNAVVLIDNQKNPRGTRIFGPVARELRDKNFTKIISLAPEVI
ncbi:MAG: 50S ribosomal protein L14 [Candidatus Omnitrophica bacterium]|nr:50S ribosomal protein L14 [Candidatus Omnitrophota bacterium]